jgi:PhoH-like ATPase
MNNDDNKKLYVLDTNILMHDPTALFRFKENDVFLPMVVIEELDHGKKGLSETARNVRQTSRFLDGLISGATNQQIKEGIALPTSIPSEHVQATYAGGKLFLQTEPLMTDLPTDLPGNSADNSILRTALALREQNPDRNVVLVSKDINMRIKGAMMGLIAQDYYSDRALLDFEMLYTGLFELSNDFWDNHSKDLHSWQEAGRTFYRIKGPSVKEWVPNMCLFTTVPQPFYAIVREVNENDATLEIIDNYIDGHRTAWGIHARNAEQNFALNVLMDDEIDFVTLQGQAGTGKTLLALAAGLMQTIEMKRYNEIIMTRVTVPLGEDIGFLPGTEEEKMTPWMGALMDNLEVLASPEHGGEWGRGATNDLIRSRIKIRSLNFMRGRTFLNKYIILDEAQNLSPKQMQTLITRAGPGTKIVCLGNLAQIDTPYLTETTSGLTYVVTRFKGWEHGAHLTLMRGERSRLADHAAQVL